MPLGVLISVYVLLALAPLTLAWGFADEIPGSLRTLAVAFGLVGFAMLLLQFISSGRFETLCSKVGINRTMRFHQLTARVLLLLLILHPLLLFLPDRLDRVPAAARMLWRMLFSNYLLSGTIALLLVLFVVTISIWRHRLPVKYEFWRASHVLAVSLIAIGGAHHVFTVGTFSQMPWLRGYWWAMLAIALGALGFSYLVKPWLLARSAYRIKSVRELGERIWEVALQPARGRSINFTAGQFAWVNFRRMPVPLLDNPFAISSSPAELPDLRLLIKARGDTSGRVGELPPQGTVYLDVPHGNFTLEGRSGEAIYLIAGGIGIAAIISILRDLAHKRDKRTISMLFGARDPRQLIYADEIAQLQNKLDINVVFSVDEPPPDWTGETGEINADIIRRNLPGDPESCLCMICGPTPMMLGAERNLRALGVPHKNIVYERFEYD